MTVTSKLFLVETTLLIFLFVSVVDVRWYRNNKAINLKDPRFSIIGGTLKINGECLENIFRLELLFEL